MKTRKPSAPPRDVSIGDYFNERCPREAQNGLLKRAVNGLMRGNIETMSGLAAASPEEIAKIRNIGANSHRRYAPPPSKREAKSPSLRGMSRRDRGSLREKYAAENNLNLKEETK